MAMDSDDSVSLPKPPPPRPAARHTAIDAAMRRFDGVEPEPQARARRAWGGWIPKDRRAVGALATAAVIAIVSVPVALTTLRDNPRPVAPQAPQAPAAPQPDQITSTVADTASDQGNDSVAAPAPVETPPAAPSQRSVPALVAAPDQRANSVEEMAKTMQAAPAPAMAPPPPPPPPPAPHAPARNEQYASEAGTQDMVVTGTRVRRPNLERPSAAGVMAERSSEPADAVGSNIYGPFLSRLQAAVRGKNKGTVIRLLDLPLRVNFAEGAQIYEDHRSIERDFDRIFTSRVRQAILDQQADRLFTNYQGAMIGDGQVWFDRTCPNSSCSPAGPVRIRSINP